MDLKEMAKYAIFIGVIYYLVRSEIVGASKAVKNSVSKARENATNKLSDLGAKVTGLDAREDRILNDAEYRRRFLRDFYRSNNG